MFLLYVLKIELFLRTALGLTASKVKMDLDPKSLSCPFCKYNRLHLIETDSIMVSIHCVKTKLAMIKVRVSGGIKRPVVSLCTDLKGKDSFHSFCQWRR